MTQIKKDAGILEKGDRVLGTHPEVEAAFMTELRQGQADTTPLFWDISDQKRAEIIQFAQIAGIADMKDMMTPEHAHIRKFNVNASRDRGAYKADGRSYDRIIGSVGDDTQSDYERAMWEIGQFLRMVQATPLWSDAVTQDRVINTVLDAYVNTQEFYRELMKGEDGLVRIYRSYYDRVRAIGLKALVKSGFDRRNLPTVKEKSKKFDNVEALNAYFNELFLAQTRNSKYEVSEKTQEFARRYIHRVNAIGIESQTAVKRIREKPDNQDGLAKRYTESEFKSMETDGLRVFDLLCEQIGISKTDALERIAELRLGNGQLLNVGSFDLIGRPTDMKTMKPIPQEILELLDKMESD